MIAPGAITPFWIGSGQLYSTAVQEALDNYTGLDAKDLALINSIITNLGSNYDLIDEIFLFVLGSNIEANGSIGLKGTVGDNSSGGTFDVGGNLFNGVDEFFDTTIVLSTDLTFASLNDIDVQCFVTDNLDSNDTIFLFGSITAGRFTQLWQEPNNTRLNYAVNSNDGAVFDTASGLFLDDTLYGIRREDDANQELFINGVQVDSEADVSSGLPIEELYVGARNFSGVAGLFINAKIAVCSIEASIGFDNALFNTVIRNSLTAYGTI